MSSFGGPRRRFPSGPRRLAGPSPVKEGEEYDVTIEAVGKRGDGIAKVENFVIFVPGTREGDRVRVRITGLGRNFATATVVR
ncbi:MAG: TRAM domain-containing protein [Candidatus Bathyarchaeia archaeon]